MDDSDYDYEEDASDDEYIGDRSGTSSRAQTQSKRRAQEKPRKLQAWQTERSLQAPEYTTTVAEADDGTIKQSVQEREEERKRKR